MKTFIKQLLCSHSHDEFIRNIHGDEINVYNGKRSIWRCTKCDHTKAKSGLFNNDIAENRHAQTLQRTLDMVAAIRASEDFEYMTTLADGVYAHFCLKEMHLATLEGRTIAQRGPMVYESLPHIEEFMLSMEYQIKELDRKIKAHGGAAQRIREVAERLGVPEKQGA